MRALPHLRLCYQLPLPAPPMPERDHHQYNGERKSHRRGPEPSARPIDGARPQRGRFTVSREPKSNETVANGGTGFGMPAGSDCDILLAVPKVGHRVGDRWHR